MYMLLIAIRLPQSGCLIQIRRALDSNQTLRGQQTSA
jgi:hypothetical protein